MGRRGRECAEQAAVQRDRRRWADAEASFNAMQAPAKRAVLHDQWDDALLFTRHWLLQRTHWLDQQLTTTALPGATAPRVHRLTHKGKWGGIRVGRRLAADGVTNATATVGTAQLSSLSPHTRTAHKQQTHRASFSSVGVRTNGADCGRWSERMPPMTVGVLDCLAQRMGSSASVPPLQQLTAEEAAEEEQAGRRTSSSRWSTWSALCDDRWPWCAAVSAVLFPLPPPGAPVAATEQASHHQCVDRSAPLVG